MNYIKKTADAMGSHGNPQDWYETNLVELPDDLMDDYLATRGYATITVKNNVVTKVTVNTAALEAYLAEHPETAPAPTLEERVTALEQGGVTPGESDLPERVSDLEDAVSDLTDAVNNLPTGGGAGDGDASAVWDELAAAYKEGVQSA